METTLQISKIKIGKRQRRDMGDLKSLAASIKELGMLQAIVCTRDNHLVCGERRLRATRDILKRKTIDVRVMDVDIIKAENAENEYRKALLPSEKVAWAATIEDSGRYGGRQGERTDLTCAQNGHKLPKSSKTRTLVAADVGFSSHQQLQRAQKVVKHGCKELVDAMDSGAVNISRAANIVDKHNSKEKQQAVVAKLLGGNAKEKHQAERAIATTAAQTFAKRMDDIVARVDGIEEQFGGVADMFESEIWATSTKTQKRKAIACINAACGRMQSLNRCAKAYGKKIGLL